MTDQETLNKLFEAALKEPEKPQASPSRFANASRGGGAATAVAPAIATATPRPVTQVQPRPTQTKAIQAKAEQVVETKNPDADSEAAEALPQTESAPEPMAKKGKLIAIIPSVLTIAGAAAWFLFLR